VLALTRHQCSIHCESGRVAHAIGDGCRRSYRNWSNRAILQFSVIKFLPGTRCNFDKWSIRFSWPKRYHSHKLYVLCHKSLEDISPRIGYHNKERLRIVYLHVRAIRSLATRARHRHKRICKSSLLKWKYWPSTQGGAHGPRPQNWCDFFRFVLRRVSETKVKVFPKRK